MPTVSEMFPKPHLTGDDLPRSTAAKISRVVQVEVNDPKTGDQEMKWSIYFEGKTKYLILNVTNARSIAEIVGSDQSEDWLGAIVELYPLKVNAFGETHNTVRIREYLGGVPAQQRTPEELSKELGYEDEDEFPPF